MKRKLLVIGINFSFIFNIKLQRTLTARFEVG